MERVCVNLSEDETDKNRSGVDPVAQLVWWMQAGCWVR
jgi:hypothetical protein